MARLMHEISKKRKTVMDGVFKAELNEFFRRELFEDGYTGVDVRHTPSCAEIVIHATKTREVVGEDDKRIKELSSLVQQRFGLPAGHVRLFTEQVKEKGLSAIAQAESLRYKLFGQLPVRRACHSVMRFIMEQGAVGCEIKVSGKLRAQRAKSMKFRDGYMLKSGTAPQYYVRSCTRHVYLRAGVMGIKVMIMLKHDPENKVGPKVTLPDVVTIIPLKDEPAMPAKLN
jgi:small subunit ribosomal protein S3e